MEFLGNVEGMKFTPVTNYNSYLKNNKSFEMDPSGDFENILNQQTAALQNSQTIQGGVSASNLEDMMTQSNIRATQVAENSESAGTLMNSFSKSINGGLSSVNDSINAANKAQEALAMGENISAHDVMIATEKASLSLDMALQLRNKLVNAYNEINQVRV